MSEQLTNLQKQILEYIKAHPRCDEFDVAVGLDMNGGIIYEEIGKLIYYEYVSKRYIGLTPQLLITDKYKE